MAEIIIVRPKFDTATTFLYEWTRKLVGVSLEENPQHEYIEFGGDEATTVNVHEAVDTLKNRSNTLYIHFDHGVYDKLFGHDRDVVFEPDTIHKLRDCVVYAFACESARELGQEAIRNGVRAYLGYKEIFGFVLSKSKDFKTVAVIPALRLISGEDMDSVRQEVENTLKTLLERFYKEYKATGSYDSYMSAVWCYKDLRGLTLLGDGTAKIKG